jgi:hypothetical protein
MAVQALWACRRPRSMTPPFWLPVLSVDIRKLPNSNAAKRNRGASIRSGAVTDGDTGSAPSIISTAEDTSTGTTATLVGSVSFESQPPLSVLRGTGSNSRKPLRATGTAGSTKSNASQTGTRYWSEYDHPEEGDEDDGNAYYIYVNPDAPEESMVPFKDTFEKVYNTFRHMFSGEKPRKGSVESDPLLSTSVAGVLPKSTFSEDDLHSTSSSEDEDEQHASLRSQYGTFLRHDYHRDSNNGTISQIEADDVITLTLFSSISLFFSTTISLVLLVLSAVGKNKAREEVDIVVSLGVFVSLAFALAGFWGLVRQGAGWTRVVVASGVFALVLLVDGVLMGKMVADLRKGRL